MKKVNSISLINGALRQLVGTIIGFFFYLLTAGFVGWIPFLFWGGEALIFPMLGGMVLLIGLLPFHLASKLIINKNNMNLSTNEWLILGAVQAIVFSLCFIPVNFVLKLLPGWYKLDFLWALSINLIAAWFFSAAIVILASVGWVKQSKKHHK